MNAFEGNLLNKPKPNQVNKPRNTNAGNQSALYAQPQYTQPKSGWYAGDQPTASETIAQIYKVGKDNPDMLSQLNDMFNAEILNPESNLYQPYLMPTTDKVNDTNIRNTNNAMNEWNQLQAELAYWANRADRNYSDDEIINRIDMTKYPTLAKMDAYKTTGVTLDLLAPVGYSRDAMYGVLWSARNGGQTSGNYLVDAAQGIMGNGNKYQRDEALYGRRDATSDNYAPYTVGATALDDLSYKYGMQGDFTEEWLNGEGRALLNGDEQAKKDYNRIYNTVMGTKKLNAEAEEFNADVQKAIQIGEDPAVYFREGFMEARYPELYKALQGQRSGKLYETSGAVAFDYDKAVRDMQASYDSIHGTKSDEEFESEIGTSTGSEFFGNEADQLTNQIKWLDTNVNLPDFIPIASGLEIDSMRLRASAAYSDVSSWVGNSIVNGTGGEEQGKAALQIATHDYANKNLFSAWDAINNNYLTFEGQMSEETKAFLQQNFSDKFAAGQLPTEADFEQFMSSRVAGIDPDEMQLDWNSRIQDFAPGTTFDDLKFSGGEKFLQKYMPDWYERKEVPSIEEVENAIAMARSDKDFMNQWEAVRADAETVDLEIKARQQAADEAAVEVEDIYDDFAELYGEGTEQYKAAINTYQMAYPYTKGVPKEWAAYDPYQYASQAEGVTNDQLEKFYVNTKGNIGRQILQLSGLIENANTIGLPADVVENMEQHLLDLQNTIKRLERHTLKDKEDYSNQIAAFDAQFPVKDWGLSSMYAQANPNHSEVVRRAVVDPKNAIAWGAAETDRGDTVEVAQYMTDEERDNYKYIYMTEGEEAATAYFDLLYENLRVRATETLSEETREWSSQNALTATVATAASVPLTLFEAAEGGYAFLSTLRGDEYNPYQFKAGRLKESLREGSKDFIGDSLESAFGEYGKSTASVIKVLYDGVMGAVDSSLTMKFGPVGTSVVMGLGGFNSAMMDASERGASEKDAFVYALCSAVIEGATERITFKRLTEALKGGKEGTKSFLKTILSGFGSEASEEIISAVFTNIADKEIMEALSQHSILVDQYMNVAKLTREEAEAQALKDIVTGIMYQGLVGGISGSFSSGFQYGKGYLIQKFGQGQGTNITGGAGSAVATDGNVSVDSSVDAQTPQLAAPTEGTENNSNKAGGNIARAASALATAMQDGTSASQQTATVEGVLRSFGLDEMEASAAAKNIVSSGNLRVLRKLMSKTTNPEMLVKAISMGSVVDTSTCAVILNTKITSKNAYSVAGKLIAAYEADVQNKRFTDSYDAHVIFSAEADAIAEHIKSNGTLDHTAVDNANAKAKEADSKFEAAKQEEAAAHQAVLDANARFNQNPSDPQAKAAVKAAINNQYTARKNRASAENDANVAHKNLETESEKLKKQAEDFMVIARGEAKAQVAEQIQHKREAQEANEKKEAEASTANDNAVQATNETVVNEVPAVSEAETAAKIKLDEAQQKFDEAKGKEVEAARNLGNAVAKYNENTSDPQAKAEMEAAMKVLDSANAESVAAEEALKNAKAEYDSVSKQNNQTPVNQNIQQKVPSAPVVAQNPQSTTPSVEQAVGNERGVVAEAVRGDSDVRVPAETNNQITNQAEGQTVVNKANSKDQGVSQFAAKTGQNTTVLSDNVKTLLRESPFYQKTSQKKNVDRAIASIESEGYDVRKSKMLDGTTNIYTPEGQVEAYVLLKAAKENGDFQGESALAFKAKESGTTISQSLAMRQMYSEMSNEGKVLFVQRLVDQINKRYEDRGKDTRVKVPEWLSKRLEEAGNDAEAVAKVIDDAYAYIANQMPPDWRTRMNAWRYMAMLANPKTHVKNFAGNMMFLPVVRFKNQIGALGELTIPQEERTKTFGLIKSEYKDFAKEKLKEVSDVLTGGGKHNPISEIESKRKSFNWKIFEYVSKGNGKLLEKEDAFFLNKHFVNSLAGFLQARNVDVTNVDEKTLQAGLDYAIVEAQKATFRDASVLADKLSKFSTDLSNSKKRSARFGGLLVEGSVPFKKTPINIARRGVEYSPLGLLNTLTYGIADVKSGKIETTEFIDRLASGMTGTALSAVGAFLYSLGHIKIGLADKEDELEKLAGSQKYSIEIFGKSYTIDWVSPAAMSLFVGAELAELFLSDDKEFNLSSLWDAMLKITEPVFNLTMLDGINSLLSAASFSENGVAGIAERAAENYVTQFVPSVLGAFARIVDPVRRTTYTDKNIDVPSGIQYVFDNVRNKTPFWSFDGQPYLNAWGEEDVEENLVVRIFENLVSPGYLNDVEPDEVEKFLMELYDTTKEPGLIPKTTQKYFTVEGERKDLTGKEYEQLTKERGQTSKKLHEELISNPDFLTIPAKYQVYALEQVWEYATQTAKKNVEPRVVLDSWVAGATDNPAEAIMEKTTEKMKKDRSDAMEKDLYSAVDSGDVETAATYVAGIIDGGTEKSSLKRTITDHYKSIYISLYESGDYEGMAELKETLLSLGLGYKPADIEKWLVPKEEK